MALSWDTVSNVSKYRVEYRTYEFFVPAGAAVNAAVGRISATDPDEGDTLTYAITEGNGDAKFAINSGTGAITVAARSTTRSRDTTT